MLLNAAMFKFGHLGVFKHGIRPVESQSGAVSEVPLSTTHNQSFVQKCTASIQQFTGATYASVTLSNSQLEKSQIWSLHVL